MLHLGPNDCVREGFASSACYNGCRYSPGEQVFLCYGSHSNLDLLGELLDCMPCIILLAN